MSKRHFVAIAVGIMIFAAGTLAGRAQRQRPDFMIKITAPVGTMKAECQYGCRFQRADFLDKGGSADGVTDTIDQVCQTERTTCTYTLFGITPARSGVLPSK